MISPARRVLVTPLNWGLGHATRCIPVIRFLLNRGCQIFVAGDGDALELLHAEFRELKSFELNGYRPLYHEHGSLVYTLARQMPKFMLAARKEHKQVDKLISDQRIDAVISDNRYGAWSHKVPSALIIHQLNLIMPAGLQWMGVPVNALHRRYIRKFDYLWVPDVEDSRLSGRLSESTRQNTRFIGPLSRFEFSADKPLRYDVAAVLSGPEPQRTILEKILLQQLPACGLKCILVRGVMKGTAGVYHPNISVIDFAETNELNEIITRASVVVARAGYSTIMDLTRMRKKAILIPTPGQTEQEYLGDWMMQCGYAISMKQEGFDIAVALKRVNDCAGFPVLDFNTTRLPVAVEELLQ